MRKQHLSILLCLLLAGSALTAQAQYYTIEEQPKKTAPDYRPTGSSLRIGTGFPTVASVAYNYQIKPWFLLGGGVGLTEDADELPVYLEAELRTPRYKWSLFLNTKLGVIPDESFPLAELTAGASYRNLHWGIGYSSLSVELHDFIVLSLSYNLSFNKNGWFVSTFF